MNSPSEDQLPPRLAEMLIQSVDSLRGTSFPSHQRGIWNDRPPLLSYNNPNARFQETPKLLKGILRKEGVPPALRCAVWMSNILQSIEQEDWELYRTLEKVRALENAYITLLNLIGCNVSGEKGCHGDDDDDDDYNVAHMPTYGHQAPVTYLPGTTTPGRSATRRVLAALQHTVAFTYAPAVPKLAQLLLTHMSEAYAFCAIREMSHAWYFPTSRKQQFAHGAAFRDILQRLHPATAEYLQDRGVFDDPEIKPIFVDLFLEILPHPCIMRIMDIYTLEGIKVIFRVGVSLLVLFKIAIHEQLMTISNADEFWSALRTWTHHPHFQLNVVIRKAYGIHGRLLRRQLRFPSRNILRRIIKMEEEKLSTIDEDYRDTGPPAPLGISQITDSLDGQEQIRPILVQNEAVRAHLADWLPLSLRLTNLRLLYSTNYHGRSLEMFYNKVRNVKYTLILVEVLDQKNTVLGMFASQAWKVSPVVYGNGECFLFRLQPDAQCWKWNPGTKHLVTIEDFAMEQSTALLEQFMVGRQFFISLGGNKDGTCGLRLNEDFTIGESSTAEGYDNEPLHGTGEGSVFQIGLLEAYGLVQQIDGRYL